MHSTLISPKTIFKPIEIQAEIRIKKSKPVHRNFFLLIPLVVGLSFEKLPETNTIPEEVNLVVSKEENQKNVTLSTPFVYSFGRF